MRAYVVSKETTKTYGRWSRDDPDYMCVPALLATDGGRYEPGGRGTNYEALHVGGVGEARQGQTSIGGVVCLRKGTKPTI